VTDSAAVAVRLAAEGKADMILKGHLRTDQLLHSVLDKQQGLPRRGLLSDVLIYEDTLGTKRRLVGITDGGVNVAPGLEQKKEILKNAVFIFHCLGFARPRVAIMSATEIVSPAIQSTVDAAKLTELAQSGEFGSCEVFGPLALDNALIESCARDKGIASSVAGYADIMLVANLEAGNILGKSVKYFGGSACAHVIAGSKVPILIPSRVESVEDKLNSIAFGVVACE
jgi:phosphate butyryltransferase